MGAFDFRRGRGRGVSGMGYSHISMPRQSVAEARDRIRSERIKDGMDFSLHWQWEIACMDISPAEKLAAMMLRLFGDPDGTNNRAAHCPQSNPALKLVGPWRSACGTAY